MAYRPTRSEQVEAMREVLIEGTDPEPVGEERTECPDCGFDVVTGAEYSGPDLPGLREVVEEAETMATGTFTESEFRAWLFEAFEEVVDDVLDDGDEDLNREIHRPLDALGTPHPPAFHAPEVGNVSPVWCPECVLSVNRETEPIPAGEEDEFRTFECVDCGVQVVAMSGFDGPDPWLIFSPEYRTPLLDGSKTATVRYDLEPDRLEPGQRVLLGTTEDVFGEAVVEDVIRTDVADALDSIADHGHEHNEDDVVSLCLSLNQHYDDPIGFTDTVSVVLLDDVQGFREVRA